MSDDWPQGSGTEAYDYFSPLLIQNTKSNSWEHCILDAERRQRGQVVGNIHQCLKEREQEVDNIQVNQCLKEWKDAL